MHLQEDLNKQGREIELLKKGLWREIKKIDEPLKRTQAEIVARLDTLQGEINVLKGEIEGLKYQTQLGSEEGKTRLEEVERQIRELAQKVSSISLPKEEVSPDPQLLYEGAQKEFKEGNFSKAKEEFEKYLELFPTTELSSNAQFWIGECLYKEKRYKEAIIAYQEVMEKYPKSKKVPSSLLKQGMSFYELGNKDYAKLRLKEVVTKYPRSEEANIASERLKVWGVKP